MLSEQGFENLLTFQHAGYDWGKEDMYQEPEGLHLHFQLDGSASTPGFMAEMLLQSHLGEIILLPALPDEWESGSVTGLKARGGFTVDIRWRKGELTNAVITGIKEHLPPVRLGESYIDALKDSRIEIKEEYR